MSGRKMHTDSDYSETASTSSSRPSHPNEHTNYDLNTTPEEREASAYKSQLQHIIEESYPGYGQPSGNENDIAEQNNPTTALSKGNRVERSKEVAGDDRLDEVVLRSRPRRTGLTDTVTLTDRSSDQVLLRSKAKNATNLRTNSYSSTQDLRPSSMTDVSSTPTSSNRFRDLRKSINVETRALPMLRPLSTSRPFSASMVNLSRTGSLDFGGSEKGIISGSTFGPRATKTDYPKTRQMNGSPFQVDVLKGIAGIGIKVKVTSKGYAQITDIQRGGPVDKNGQVRVGDNVLFVNTTELTGHTDARVQQVLRLLPRGLTKLVISSATPPESQVQNNDHDKFKATPSQQFIEQQPPAQSSTTSKELSSLSTNGNDVLNNNNTSLPRFAPSLSPATTEFTNISPTAATSVSTNNSSTAASAVSTNRFTETVNSGAIDTSSRKHPNDSNHLSYISRPGHDLLSGKAIHKQGISLNEAGEVYSSNVNAHDQKHVSNPMIVEKNTVRTQIPPSSQESTMISRQNPQFDTSINMSGSFTDITPHSSVLSKSYAYRELSTENTFKDDSDTSNHLLSKSIFVSDNIDQSPLTSDNIDQSILSFTNNDNSALSVNNSDQLTLSSNNTDQSIVVSNNIDNSTFLLDNFDQSTLPSKNTGQSIMVSNTFSRRSETTDVNVTDALSLTANESPLKSTTASKEKLQNVGSPLWPASSSTVSTASVYRGVLVTLVDSVDGEESTDTKPEPRMRIDHVSPQATTTAAEPSATLDHRKTPVSITPTETDTRTTQNKTVSEHPVPKKRTSLVQNVNTENSKEMNASLIPLQDRRKNKFATLPRVPFSHAGTSPLYASRSLSVSTPALNSRKISSLETSSRNNENTHYQNRSVLSPAPKHTAADLSMDYVSHSRVPPRYASRSISVSSALSPKKLILSDHSSRDSESINYHNKAVLSPAPINSALSPRRTPSDASHAPAFTYPTQYTHTHTVDPSGRLSAGKNRTVEHPHAYKTVQSQLYRAVHPEIYKSTSVTMLDKTLMPQDHEFSNRSQGYNVVQQPHQKSSTSTSQARAPPFNTEANKERLDITIKKFDDLLMGSSLGRSEASPADILLWSDVKEGVSPSIREEMKATDNVLSRVSDIKRPVAPARQLRKPQEKDMDKNTEDIVQKQLTNTHTQKTKETGIKEQKQDNKAYLVVNPTSDLLSDETPTGKDLTSNMLEEKQVKSNEEYLNGIDIESAKTKNIFDQNENGSKHEPNTLDEFEKPLHLSYNITNISTHSYVNENSSNIIHNTSTNVVSDSENLLQEHRHKKDVLLQSQSVVKEDGSTTNTQITQDVNDKGRVNSSTDKLIAKAYDSREDEAKVHTLQNDILALEASQIVNDVMTTVQGNYSILYPNEVAIHASHVPPESDEDEPPPLPDIPPPLPDAPPPSFIHGGISTQQWGEQNTLYVIPKNSIESKVEKKEDTASSMSLNETIESNAVQLDVNLLHTGELTAADLSDLTNGSQLSKSPTEPRTSNADIDHARDDIRVNSPSPVDMLSEDSGMPADEDQEMVTDDTTSTPGELADNTFGLDSLKHVPCLSDIEAGLFPSSHEVSLPLLSTSEEETHNFVTGSEKGLEINFIDISHQNVDTLDLLSEDNIIGSNLPPPILPASALPIAGGITVSPEELATERSTAVQETDLQPSVPENALLATDFSHAEIQEVLSTPADETIRESALSDNSVAAHNANISNDILASSSVANVPGLHVSESPENLNETVISKRKWRLTSNTSTSPVLTAEDGIPVHVNYTEKTLLNSLSYDAFIRLVDRANAVLDAASAPRSFTLLIVHLHREEEPIPLGVQLKHEGGIWFRVSGITNGSPVWKEGSSVVGDWLLAVDSLWCDNVTVNRFLSRLAKPKHDTLLVMCRQHEDVDTTDSPMQGVAWSSKQQKPHTNGSQQKHSVSSEERKTHSHFSETAKASPSKLISSEDMTKHDRQLIANERVPLHQKQSLPLEEQASRKLAPSVTGHLLLLELEQSRSFLGQAQPPIDDALLVEQVTSPSELVSSVSEQLPPLPTQGPPLQGHALHLLENDPPLQGQSPPLQGHAPPLPGEGPPLQGQAPPLQDEVLSPPNIDHGALISNEETPFQHQNLSLSQQGTLLSQLNKQASLGTDPRLQPVECEQTSPVSKTAQVMQQESLHSPLQERSARSAYIPQERSARSAYILQQNQPQSRATLNEEVSVRRLPVRSTRRLSEEQTQSELRTTRRREYLKTAPRHSLEEPFKGVPPKETLTEEPIPAHTIVNSAELTAQLGPGVYKLIIRKGATGVGFCLEGGVGSPKGDLPITIKRIFKGGPAEKSGLLKVNDEILEVNGLKFSKMGHYEAWNHLKFLDDGEVSVTIRRK